jgi:hypothetical protein
MKRISPWTFLLVPLALASLACGSTIVTSTPTPVSAVDLGMTMISDRLNAEATQQKFDSIVEVTAQVAAATATQQAVIAQATSTQQARLDAQATANKADAIARATSEQARHDAQATQQRIDFEATQAQARRDAQATSDQSRLDLAATQQAAGTATAWSVTQVVVPTHDLWTQQAVQQNILLATNEVELSNLKVKQQRDTNVLQWLIPMLIAIFAAFVGAHYLITHSKVRVFKDADGDDKGFAFNNQKVVIFGLLPKPVLELESGEMPDVTNPAEQSKIVERDQAIKALSVMPERTTDQAAQTFNKFFGSGRQDDLPFDIIDAEEMPPAGLLDAETLQALNKDWKEAKGG